MAAFLFPGQGSQYKGMGADLFRCFSDYTRQADQVLGYSIESLCLFDKHQQLNETHYTQPALYAVTALSYLAKLHDGVQPTCAAGHSLGEYSALFAAGVYSFEEGLKLVKKRGELMQQVKGGAMIAVMGLDLSCVEEILCSHALTSVSIANINAPTQIIISGLEADVNLARTVFEEEMAVVVPLKVSGPFHTHYMGTVKEEFQKFIQKFDFKKPKFPVLSNVTAKPYAGVEEIRDLLCRQISEPVQWVDTIKNMKDFGETEFLEVGPGKSLMAFLKRILKDQ